MRRHDIVFDQTNDGSSAFISATIKLRDAMAFEGAGKYESALMSLDEAILLQKDYVDAWLIKGIILSKLGKYSDALKCYDKVIQLNSNFADAQRLKAAVFTSLNLHERAFECLAKAVELNPTNLEFRLSLANCLQRLKRFEDALQCYIKAKKQVPNDHRIDYYIGVMWGNKADYQKAIAAFEEALNIKPNFTDALLGKGIMLTKLGRNEEAKACTNELLKIKDRAKQEKTVKTDQTQKSEHESIREEYIATQKKFKEAYSETNKR